MGRGTSRSTPRVPTCPTHGLGTLAGTALHGDGGEAERELERGGNVSSRVTLAKEAPGYT